MCTSVEKLLEIIESVKGVLPVALIPLGLDSIKKGSWAAQYQSKYPEGQIPLRSLFSWLQSESATCSNEWKSRCIRVALGSSADYVLSAIPGGPPKWVSKLKDAGLALYDGRQAYRGVRREFLKGWYRTSASTGAKAFKFWDGVRGMSPMEFYHGVSAISGIWDVIKVLLKVFGEDDSDECRRDQRGKWSRILDFLRDPDVVMWIDIVLLLIVGVACIMSYGWVWGVIRLVAREPYKVWSVGKWIWRKISPWW